jgi:hypothetical protein
MILDRLRSLKAAKPGDAIAGKMDGSPAPQLDAMSQSAL